MKIRHVKIENFRGTKTLNWAVNGDFVCLIGPGDSTKSTILEAIRLALSPRPTEKFDDADFYRGNPSGEGSSPTKFLIQVTVGQFPEELFEKLFEEEKFGLLSRGWNARENRIEDEPENWTKMVLTIQLKVDSTLDPIWAVVNERNQDGREISYRDRAALGAFNLDDFFGLHLTWGRNSPLSRLMGKDDENLSSVLAGARAGMLEGFKPDELEATCKFCQDFQQEHARELVSPSLELAPGLDRVSLGAGSVALHSGKVPIRRQGLGTRRLLAASMRQLAVKEGSITLIDEVEHGLEPHRIRDLIQILKRDQKVQEEDAAQGQVILTTHSPVAVKELHIGDLRIVRKSPNHEVKVKDVASIEGIKIEKVRDAVRKAQEGLLGKKIIVCEGATEVGFCRALNEWWQTEKKMRSLGVIGVVLVDGCGTSAPNVAEVCNELGYPVALLADSDRPKNVDEDSLKARGIKVLLWDGEMAIEERVFMDLPWEGVREILRWRQEDHGSSLKQEIEKHLPNKKELGSNVEDWTEDNDLRIAIGKAAAGRLNEAEIKARIEKKQQIDKRDGWFKCMDFGEELGEIVVKNWAQIAGTDLANNINELRDWVDKDD